MLRFRGLFDFSLEFIDFSLESVGLRLDCAVLRHSSIQLVHLPISFSTNLNHPDIPISCFNYPIAIIERPLSNDDDSILHHSTSSFQLWGFRLLQ